MTGIGSENYEFIGRLESIVSF